MDPTRLTLYSSVGGLLLAALVLGPVFIMALVDHEGTDDPLQEGSMSRPAAQEAFAKGLKDEDAAYLNDRFEMTMEMIQDESLLLGEAVVRADPHAGDFQFIMSFDLKAIEEHYGADGPSDNGNAVMNETFETEGDLDLTNGMFAGMGVEDLDQWEISFSSIGEVNSLSFAPGTGITWRDFTPKEPMTLFGQDDEETFDQAVSRPDPGLGDEELARFLDADESITVHEVEASGWEGTPTWMVTTTVTEDGYEETAVFHFRKSDMAPLAFDLHMDGASENGFFSMLEETDEPLDLEALEDVRLHMKMRFRYGDSVEFESFDDHTRLPVSPETADERYGDRIVRNLTDSHDAPVPLDDLELHFVVLQERDPEDPFAEPKVTQTLGVLRLKDAHEIETDDHRIVYEDNDEDGRLSSGDRFYVKTTDENGVWSNETHTVDLVIYDTWAEQYEGAPGPGVAWLLLLALGGATALHRRRHTHRKHVESIK